MQLFFMFLPIVASLIILIYALKKGFDRTAFYISAAVAMVIAMFMMKHNATWYGLMLALTVPLAVSGQRLTEDRSYIAVQPFRS